LSRPGLGGLPAAIQRSRDCPPFHARVVKPILALTPQRSRVRARMSPLIAATVIGRPVTRRLTHVKRRFTCVIGDREFLAPWVEGTVRDRQQRPRATRSAPP